MHKMMRMALKNVSHNSSPNMHKMITNIFYMYPIKGMMVIHMMWNSNLYISDFSWNKMQYTVKDPVMYKVGVFFVKEW